MDGTWIGRLYYVDPDSGLGKRAQAPGSNMAETSRKLKAIQKRVDRGCTGRDDSTEFGAFATIRIASSLEASDRKQPTRRL